MTAVWFWTLKQVSSEVKLPQKLRNRGTLILSDSISKKYFLTKKIFLGGKTGKKLYKRLTAQRGRERTYNSKCSEVIVLRNGTSGPRVRKKPSYSE